MTAYMRALVASWGDATTDAIAGDIAAGLVYLSARLAANGSELSLEHHIERAAAAWNGIKRRGEGAGR